MPSSQQRELTAAHKRCENLSKDLDKRNTEVAKQKKEIENLKRRADHHDSRAKQLQQERNELETQLTAEKAGNTTQDPIGQGAYEIRTKSAQIVAGVMRPAGTRLGFITAAVGVTPQVVVDSLHFGSGLLVEAEHHELFTDLMSRDNMAAELAVAMEAIKEKDAQIKSHEDSGQQLEEVKSELSSVKGLRTKAENTLADANAHIGELETKVEDQQAKIAELEQELDELTEPDEDADDAAPEDDPNRQTDANAGA